MSKTQVGTKVVMRLFYLKNGALKAPSNLLE